MRLIELMYSDDEKSARTRHTLRLLKEAFLIIALVAVSIYVPGFTIYGIAMALMFTLLMVIDF